MAPQRIEWEPQVLVSLLPLPLFLAPAPTGGVTDLLAGSRHLHAGGPLPALPARVCFGVRLI